MPWDDYILQPEDRRKSEPWNPESWIDKDPLSMWIREYAGPETRDRLETSAGWAFAAWTRLPYAERMSALFERAVVAEATRRGYSKQFDDFVGIGVQSRAYLDFPFSWRKYDASFYPDRYAAVVNVSTPTAPGIIDELSIEANEMTQELFPSHQFVPVIVQYLSPPTAFAQVSQPPTEASGNASLQPIHSSDIIKGTSASGLMTNGLATAFGKDNISTDPRIIGSKHVLGNVGDSVQAFGQKIGTVSKVDTGLDAALVEFDLPWAVDYRVRTLGIVPAAPLLPTTSMNIQYVDQNGIIQTGHIWQTNLFAPGQATIGVTPSFTCSFVASPGDSGALIMTGHHGRSALNHYSGVTSPQVLDMYRSAMLGHILGGASGGPASVPSQTIGIPIVEVLSSLSVDPLHR
jgi:hypothetical protein